MKAGEAMYGTIDNKRLRKLLLSAPEIAIRHLYEHYHQGLLNISISLTHDRAASEEIVQEVFTHVWEKADQLGQHQTTPILPYLVKVVKYKSITFFKSEIHLFKLKKRYREESAALGMPESVEVQIIREEVYQELYRVINSFPKRERECLLMRTDEGLTTEEIARRLGVSGKAVERSVTSGKKRLRRYLIQKGRKI